MESSIDISVQIALETSQPRNQRRYHRRNRLVQISPVQITLEIGVELSFEIAVQIAREISVNVGNSPPESSRGGNEWWLGGR